MTVYIGGDARPIQNVLRALLHIVNAGVLLVEKRKSTFVKGARDTNPFTPHQKVPKET
jgi:hypothetical protein